MDGTETHAPKPPPLWWADGDRVLAECRELKGGVRREVLFPASINALRLRATDCARLLAWLPAAEAWVKNGAA